MKARRPGSKTAARAMTIIGPTFGAGPMPPKNKRRVDVEAIAKAFEAAQHAIAKASGLSPEEFRRIEKQIRQHQEAAQAIFPSKLRQQFEAAERQRRAKVAAEAEVAAQEAARQARRARRKGVGGRRLALTPTEIEAARQRLRGAKKRRFDLAYKDFIKWWGQDPEREKRKVPGERTYREKVFRPELGPKRAD
jgi:hypothetical protein